jgi:hypothetical protein
MLTNINHSPAEGNFCGEYGNTLKPAIVQDYNKHMGYVDKSDRMTNSYSICRRTWKWTKKLFFHLLDLSILNSYILLTSCGSKLTHRDFRLTLVRDLIQEGGRVPRPQTTPWGRPTTSTSQPTRLDIRQNEHWPSEGRRVRCRVCATKNKETWTKFCCSKCNVGLCVDPCFRVYHTQMHF